MADISFDRKYDVEEIFDIVYEKGQPTGETMTRSQAHAEGIRHRTAHICVVRKYVKADERQFESMASGMPIAALL